MSFACLVWSRHSFGFTPIARRAVPILCQQVYFRPELAQFSIISVVENPQSLNVNRPHNSLKYQLCGWCWHRACTTCTPPSVFLFCCQRCFMSFSFGRLTVSVQEFARASKILRSSHLVGVCQFEGRWKSRRFVVTKFASPTLDHLSDPTSFHKIGSCRSSGQRNLPVTCFDLLRLVIRGPLISWRSHALIIFPLQTR